MPNEENKSRLNKKLNEAFGIDLRSMALFRILIGILIIADLIIRSADIKGFYTDEGVMPRGLQMGTSLKWHFSVHLLSGLLEAQIFLFLIAGFFAFLLLIGYRTKLATIVSWALIVSLQTRNEMILDGGDQWLRLILFWCIFLPLGACYSVDSALNPSDEKLPKRILSFSTIGLFLQFALVYWTTGALKWHNESWSSGNGVYYTLYETQYSTEMGLALLEILPLEILKFMTFAIMWLWILGPLLLVSPFFTYPVRILAMTMFLITHIAFHLTLDIEFFPYVSSVALIPFLPSNIWDKLIASLKTPNRLNLKIYYDEQYDFCKKVILIVRTFFLIPETTLTPAKQDPSINEIMNQNKTWIVIDYKNTKHIKLHAFKSLCEASPILGFFIPILNTQAVTSLGENIYTKVSKNQLLGAKTTQLLQYRPINIKLSMVGNLLAAFFSVYIFLFNLDVFYTQSLQKTKYKLSDRFKNIGNILYINQFWHMFVSYDKKGDRYALWNVILAKQKNGKEVDLFNYGKPVSFEKHKNLSDIYKNRLWKKYLLSARSSSNTFLPYFALYECKRWNSKHTETNKIYSIDFYSMNQKILLNHELGEIEKVLIGKYQCPAES